MIIDIKNGLESEIGALGACFSLKFAFFGNSGRFRGQIRTQRVIVDIKNYLESEIGAMAACIQSLLLCFRNSPFWAIRCDFEVRFELNA